MLNSFVKEDKKSKSKSYDYRSIFINKKKSTVEIWHWKYKDKCIKYVRPYANRRVGGVLPTGFI